MIVAAISFAISGAYVIKNEEETQILEEEGLWDFADPDFNVNYSLRENQPFQYHEIHVKQKEGTGANNTWMPGDKYAGIYVQVYNGKAQPINPYSSQNILSYHCETRNFSIIITQMSIYLYFYEVVLYLFYRDASSTLWYLFGGFVGIWAVCIILLFANKRQKDQVRAK